MQPFKYTHLDEIGVEDVIAAFPEWGESFAREAYIDWYHNFARFSSICYRAQNSKHHEMAWNAFCREYNLSVDESLDSDQQWDYDIYADRIGLAKHDNDFARVQGRLEHRDKVLQPDRPIFGTLNDAFERIIARMQSTESFPDDHNIQFMIYGLWFNTIINNTPEQVAVYRKMTYPDYLNTDHWRRVRTAMLIAHRGRCQADTCWQMDSYWFDEKWLHVHHVNYKNRGNERFADLRLVCKECHERIHAGNADIFPGHLDAYYEVQAS